MAIERPRIPVVMFHSVNANDPAWLWDGLTCPVRMFEKVVRSLRSRGYGSATLDELVELQSVGLNPERRQIVLTFDDGYLDNWVYVLPILKRLGLRGIVYVNPEFVDPSVEPRATLEDVWAGRVDERDLCTTGFLNWTEIDLMSRSGILEIGSHSMSHTWYATGPRIVDFHRPGLVTPWLSWNARPERKSFYRREDQSNFVPWGTPIHEHGRSLGIRRYFPDEDIAQAVVSHVAARGGAEYFARASWMTDLGQVARMADGGRGRFESDEERDARYRYEIGDAFASLEGRLGRPVRHFCWPGGAYCDDSWAVLEQLGCRSTTLRRNDRLRWETGDAKLVRRISEHRKFSFCGRSWTNSDSKLLAVACDVELGKSWARNELRARKAFAAMQSLFVR